MEKDEVVEVWGMAAGLGSTSDTERGSFAVRYYTKRLFPQEDWLQVLKARIVKKPKDFKTKKSRKK